MSEAKMDQLMSAMTAMMKAQQEEVSILRAAVTSIMDQKSSPPAIDRPELTIKALMDSIEPFSYDPSHDLTFERWYARYEDLFNDGKPTLDDKGRTRLLLQRLDAEAHKRYADFILPATPKERTLANTVKTLKTLFDKPESLFCAHWKCFQISKTVDEDFSTYAANVNKCCENFKLATLKPDDFKSLIFILGLRDSSGFRVARTFHIIAVSTKMQISMYALQSRSFHPRL